MRELLAHKMAMDAVPPGAGPREAIAFLTSPGRLEASAREATKWVHAAIAAVRDAADPNPWRNADNEAIAAEVLRLIAAKRRGNWAPET